jgi:hypothetical protein
MRTAFMGVLFHLIGLLQIGACVTVACEMTAVSGFSRELLVDVGRLSAVLGWTVRRVRPPQCEADESGDQPF